MVLKKLQPALSYASTRLAEDVSLAALARQAGLSVSHLHRAFSAASGETPKHFTLRLRLGRAAALLLTTSDSVLQIALSCGFQSHEVFSRAFRRRFGITPTAYRTRGFVPAIPQSIAQNHSAIVNSVAPCIGLYPTPQKQKRTMTYSITKREISPQPALFMRRRVKRSEIAATIAGTLQAIFLHAQQSGIAFAGPPFARYPEMSLGFLTIEPGMPIATAVDQSSLPAESGIIAGILPGGPVAFTTHSGPYDTLPDAHAAIGAWIESQGLTPSGAAWESYVTDPGDYPDPKDWKTEIFCPLAS